LVLVTAVEFRQELSGGTTRPLVLTCEHTDGKRQDYAVKLKTTRCGVYGLCCELICSHLAALLGIEAVEPVIVDLSDAFVETVPTDSVKSRLRGSLGANFGTRFLTGGYSTWPRSKPLSSALRIPACEILGFDVFIQNSDRRPEKPNVLWKENELIVLDHELAFPFPFLIGCVDPWNDQFIPGIRNHLFFRELHRDPFEIRRFQGALEAITDNDFESLFNLVPQEWIQADRIQMLRQYLPRRRDAANTWIESIRRELQ
jgi:hypothetical protein